MNEDRLPGRHFGSISSAVLVQVKGWQRSFQPPVKVSMAAMRSVTDVKLPRRMACRVMMEKKTSSGSGGALPRRRPLRTGHARFPGSSAQASPGGSLPGRRAGLLPLPIRLRQ